MSYRYQFRQMPKIVLIEKSGKLKTLSVKDFTEETLYKKAGFKTREDFKLQHTWSAEDGIDQSIKLYAKTNGRAGQENKYDFPPPVDETLFFGSCLLVGTNPNTGEVIDLVEEDWEEIYEYLFGGFEDIESDDSSNEEDIYTDDELEAIQKNAGTKITQTKQGYAKDGFIVDDDDDDNNYSDESSDAPPPKKPNTKSKKLFAKTAVTNANIEPTKTEDHLNVQDCESELSEESYD